MPKLTTAGKLALISFIVPKRITQAEAGRLLGVSRERVRQLTDKHDLQFATVAELTHNTCPLCGETTGSAVTTYHMACYSKNVWVTVPCETCGTDFRYRVSTIVWRRLKDPRYTETYSPRFCSQPCRRKVSPDQVLEIRARHAKGDGTAYEMAKEYGVSVSNISAITARKTWKKI